MAFDISNLTLMAHGNGRNIYYYSTTADTLATIRASGYFGQDSGTGQQAADMLTAGDVIIVSGSDGLQNLRVDTVSSNTVTTEVGPGEAMWITVPIMNANAAGNLYLAAPFDGNVGRLKVTTQGEISASTLELQLRISGTDVTGGLIQFDQSGQGAGEVYETTATANNAVSEGDAVQINWGGGAGGEILGTELDLLVQIEFVPA